MTLAVMKTEYRIGFPVTDQNTGQSYNGLVELSKGKSVIAQVNENSIL